MMHRLKKYKMEKIGIAVHGGAGPMSDKIEKNKRGYEEGLKKALEAGYKVLEKKGNATEAVEEAVRHLEDDPLFNSGHGSALSSEGKVEMDAAIMDGVNLKAGAVSIVRNVKNPVTLAAFIMKHTEHVLISGEAAEKLAIQFGLALANDEYFITNDQYQAFLEEKKKDTKEHATHGTVGAVALDLHGNIAAATSTGGTMNALPGRVGDSCIIGAGCYANNETCAISSTGDGELIIIHVIAYSVAMYKELTGSALQAACDHIIHEKLKHLKGDIGLISIDREGNFGIAHHSERMHRAWIGGNAKKMEVRYK
jgi:beta-aspartyl-peptidase (threonine type)